MTAKTKSADLETSASISLRLPWERALWKQRFHCSLGALHEVISAVGRSVLEVEREFARRQAPAARVVGRPRKVQA
ncbi:MAG: DUF3606 domain-containing protein [Dokdonella sp.]|uniref:DUF3606 domain-containing protein n=1 Tax=Dokdonella sp. TaxID=2291710 RepID=UPI003266A4BE